MYVLNTELRSGIYIIPSDFSTSPLVSASRAAAGMRRAGTLIRSPIEGRTNKDKDKADGDMRASEVCLFLHMGVLF
jgi:hypothetical protein